MIVGSIDRISVIADPGTVADLGAEDFGEIHVEEGVISDGQVRTRKQSAVGVSQAPPMCFVDYNMPLMCYKLMCVATSLCASSLCVLRTTKCASSTQVAYFRPNKWHGSAPCF